MSSSSSSSVRPKLAMLSSLLLLGCALNANAAQLNFRRTELSAAAKDLLARNTRVTRASSRISREPHVRLESRDMHEPIQAEFADDYYTSDIMLGGKEYKVVLDTCSPDMWVDAPPAHNYHQTTYHAEITYNLSTGSLAVDGTVGIAPLEFGTYKIENQAFLNIHDTAGELYNSVGFHGFFGLGLEYAPGASKVEEAVHKHEGDSSTRGQTVLANYFSAYPEVDKVVGVSLQRTEDWSGTSGVDLSLGEYPEEWMGIQETDAIDLYPEDSPKWTAVIHGVAVEGAPIQVQSKIDGVPAGSLVAHFGVTGPTVLPRELFDQIYRSIPGAVPYEAPDGEKRWIVPCLSDIEVQIKIGERTFPIHPADVTEFWEHKPEAVKDYTVCISSFRGLDIDAPLYDLHFGASFARNVYSIYGFPVSGDDGSIVEQAYLLLKPKEQEDKDIGEIRGYTLEQGPEELSPEKTVQKLKEHHSGGHGHSTTKHHPTNTHGGWQHSTSTYHGHGHSTKTHEYWHSTKTHGHGHSTSTYHPHHPSSSPHHGGHSSSYEEAWPAHPSSKTWHHGGHHSSSTVHVWPGHPSSTEEAWPAHPSSSTHHWHGHHSSSTEEAWPAHPSSSTHHWHGHQSSSTEEAWPAHPSSSTHHWHGHQSSSTEEAWPAHPSSSTHHWHGHQSSSTEEAWPAHPSSSTHHGHGHQSSSTEEAWPAHPSTTEHVRPGHHSSAGHGAHPSSSSDHAEPSTTGSSSGSRGGNRGGNREGDADDDTVSGGAVAGSSTSSGTLEKFMPIILGLLGANIFVGLVLIGLAIMNYVKRNGSSKKTGPHVYVPVSKAGDP